VPGDLEPRCATQSGSPAVIRPPSFLAASAAGLAAVVAARAASHGSPPAAAARRRAPSRRPSRSRLVLARAANWLLGAGTVWLFRPELDLAASGIAPAPARWCWAWPPLSRRIADLRARAVHPWAGAAALVLCGAGVSRPRPHAW
jgi:hypothetical protein